MHLLICITFRKNIQKFKLGFVINLHESVKLIVICRAIRNDARCTILLPDAFECPFTINEAYIPKLIIVTLASGAHKLAQLMLKLKDSVASTHDKQLAISITTCIEAVTEPGETIPDLTIPGRFILILPIDFFNISETIETKVHRETHSFVFLILHVALHRKLFEHSVLGLVPHQLRIYLINVVNSVILKSLIICLICLALNP